MNYLIQFERVVGFPDREFSALIEDTAGQTIGQIVDVAISRLENRHKISIDPKEWAIKVHRSDFKRRYVKR